MICFTAMWRALSSRLRRFIFRLSESERGDNPDLVSHWAGVPVWQWAFDNLGVDWPSRKANRDDSIASTEFPGE